MISAILNIIESILILIIFAFFICIFTEVINNVDKTLQKKLSNKVYIGLNFAVFIILSIVIIVRFI